jgi:hypothetical protein
METSTDENHIEDLEAKLKILKRLNKEGKLANYVYMTSMEGEEISPEIYLPEVIQDIIAASLNDPVYTNFFSVWQSVMPYRYVNYIDGSALDILVFATAWLAVGLKVASRDIQFQDKEGKTIEEIPEPFYQLSLAVGEDDLNQELFKLIDEQVYPALRQSYSTDLTITRINAINSAFQFYPNIKTGLVAQDRLEKTVEKIIKNYKNTVPLPAYDDVLYKGVYVLDLVDPVDRLPIELGTGDHLDLFDDVRCSATLPVCIYNGGETKTGKAIFESVNDRVIKTDGSTLDLQKRGFFTLPKAATSLRIVMYVYIGPDAGDPSRASLNDFAEVVFSFKRGLPGFSRFTVTFKFQSVEEVEGEKSLLDTVLDRLNAHMTRYQAAIPYKVENRMTSLNQMFIVPSLVLDKEVFMFGISSDPVNSLFRFYEHDSPWSQKKIIRMGVLLIGAVEVVIKPEVITNMTYMVVDKGKLSGLVKGDHIVKVTLKAQNLQQYNIGRFVILRFLAQYVKNYDANYKIYNQIFPRPYMAPIVPISTVNDEGANNAGLRNIKLLRFYDPALWILSNYTRVAASNVSQQVKPIGKNQVEEYRRKGRMVIKWPVEVKGLPEDKQTQASLDPRTNQPIRVYYTTLTDEAPYIALVPNQGRNSETHPYIPKCQKTPSGLIVNPDWTLSLPEKEKVVPRNGKKTLRPLNPGESGPVQGSLNHYVGNGSPIYRHGLWRSKSSFLHAVLFATSEVGDEYRNVYASEAGEKLVIELREMLAGYASACLQENPGKSIEEIAQALADPNVYLDPLLHYRALEERFGVNIFVASPGDSKELLLQAPNFKMFYTRTKRRPLTGSMVVIRLPLPHINDPTIFQCEILYVNQGNGGSIFSDSVTDKLEEATNKIARAIKVTPVCVAKTTPDGKAVASQVLAIEESIVNTQVPAKALVHIASMYVDAYGKCRGICVNLPTGSKVWLITPPIEPLSGPNVGDATNDPDIQTVDGSFEVEAVTPLKADLRDYVISQLFAGTLTQYTPQDGQLVGFWSRFHGLTVYVPLEPTPWKDSYTPVRFAVAYNSITTESYTRKLQRLQRVVTVAIQIMKRLYVLSGLTPEEFIGNHMTLATPSQPMTTEGGVRLIPLAVMKDFDLLLDHFVSQFPSLFDKKKLLCDSEQYFINMSQRLINFADNIEKERRTTITKLNPEGNTDRLTKFPRFLEFFYVCYEDFTVHTPTQQIFMSTNRLNLELTMQKESQVHVAQRLEPSLLTHREPYVYIHSDKKFRVMFLVQNVEGGDVSRAATVAAYWAQNRVNPGFNAPPIVPEASAKIVEAKSVNIVDPFVPLVLKYQSGEYAALLCLSEK